MGLCPNIHFNNTLWMKRGKKEFQMSRIKELTAHHWELRSILSGILLVYSLDQKVSSALVERFTPDSCQVHLQFSFNCSSTTAESELFVHSQDGRTKSTDSVPDKFRLFQSHVIGCINRRRNSIAITSLFFCCCFDFNIFYTGFIQYTFIQVYKKVQTKNQSKQLGKYITVSSAYS